MASVEKIAITNLNPVSNLMTTAPSPKVSDTLFAELFNEKLSAQQKTTKIDYVGALDVANAKMVQAENAFAQVMAEDEIDRQTEDASARVINNEAKQAVAPANLVSMLPDIKEEYVPYQVNARIGDQQGGSNSVNDDNLLVAQAFPQTGTQTPDFRELTPENVNVEGLRTNRIEITPFQLFIDKAVDALTGISAQEYRVNNLIDLYAQGKVSIEEVSIETTKLNLAISFATTVITQATQTFKELQGMQV